MANITYIELEEESGETGDLHAHIRVLQALDSAIPNFLLYPEDLACRFGFTVEICQDNDDLSVLSDRFDWFAIKVAPSTHYSFALEKDLPYEEQLEKLERLLACFISHIVSHTYANVVMKDYREPMMFNGALCVPDALFQQCDSASRHTVSRNLLLGVKKGDTITIRNHLGKQKSAEITKCSDTEVEFWIQWLC